MGVHVPSFQMCIVICRRLERSAATLSHMSTVFCPLSSICHVSVSHGRGSRSDAKRSDPHLSRTRANGDIPVGTLPLESANQSAVRCSLYTPSAAELFRSLSPLSYEPLSRAASLIYRNREDGGPGKTHIYVLFILKKKKKKAIPVFFVWQIRKKHTQGAKCRASLVIASSLTTFCA